MPKRKRVDTKPTEIEAEPGADKRLANILRKALNTPPARHRKEPQRQRSDRKSEKR